MTWKGKSFHSGIIKESVPEITITRNGVENDVVVESKHHGGRYKAVYAYFEDDYAWWKNQTGREFPPGAMGENILIDGLSSTDFFLGDQITIGDATLEVSQPRIPCYKLEARLNEEGFIKTFAEAGRYGLYFRVPSGGTIRTGDAGSISYRHPDQIHLDDVYKILIKEKVDAEIARKVLTIPELDAKLRERAEALV
jgi:MOSC domain-containing protein YiiM